MREVPGMIFTGEMVSHSMVNNGVPVPLYDLVASGINTPEGWNAAAMSANRRSFRAIHGRNPVDELEISQWLDELTRGYV